MTLHYFKSVMSKSIHNQIRSSQYNYNIIILPKDTSTIYVTLTFVLVVSMAIKEGNLLSFNIVTLPSNCLYLE